MFSLVGIFVTAFKGHPFISDVDWAEVEDGKVRNNHVLVQKKRTCALYNTCVIAFTYLQLSPPYIPANTASESGRSHLSEIGGLCFCFTHNTYFSWYFCHIIYKYIFPVSTTQTPHHHHREEEDLDKYVDFNYLRDAK